MEDAYMKALETVDQLIQGGVDPLDIAAVMTTVGLSLYRTVLSQSDYEEIVDCISEQRHEVKKLIAGEDQKGQDRLH